MDKHEQVAREVAAKLLPHTTSVVNCTLIAAALRQCEADTIRRCARVIGDYTTVKWNHVAAEEAENEILSLLPKEPDHD